MNKSEFVAAIATKANLSQAEAGRVVDAVLGTVTETLARGEDIRFTGFGSFEVVEQAARVGRNPRTGAEIAIPASRAAKVPARRLAEVRCRWNRPGRLMLRCPASPPTGGSSDGF